MAKQSTYTDAINIYETLYSKFPDGQFSGEALYKIFYAKLEKERYEEALKLGKIHLAKFSNTNSAPAVMYWMLSPNFISLRFLQWRKVSSSIRVTP